MAFLRTFTALLVAAAIWMLAFVGFDESRSPLLKTIAGWLSPLRVVGWLVYLVLFAACLVLAFRFLGRGSAPADERNGR